MHNELAHLRVTLYAPSNSFEFPEVFSAPAIRIGSVLHRTMQNSARISDTAPDLYKQTVFTRKRVSNDVLSCHANELFARLLTVYFFLSLQSKKCMLDFALQLSAVSIRQILIFLTAFQGIDPVIDNVVVTILSRNNNTLAICK